MRHRSLRMRVTFGLLIVGCLWSATTFGDDKEKRRQVVNGILQLLIESQVPPPRGPANLANEPRPTAVGKELTAARQVLEQLRNEAAALNASLQRESATSPHLRGILGETTKFQTRCEALLLRSRQVVDHRALVTEVAALDQEWRTLSLRIEQIPRLPKTCRDSVGRVRTHHESLCQHLAVEPTIDRRNLVRTADTLATHLHALIEDITFETRGTFTARDLVLEAGRAEQAAISFADLCNDPAPYQRLVERYRVFARSWEPLATRLYALKSRHVDREVVQIQQADQRLRELLWLPRSLNRELLTQLGNGILADVDRVLDAIPLSLLLELPTRDEVPSAAYDLFGYCQHFAECATRSQDVNDLLDAYSELPAAWVAFSRHFRNVPSPQLKQQLATIEQRILALREPLGIPGGFDREEARRLAASVEHLAEHLADDIQGWLANHPLPEPEKRDLLNRQATLRLSARQLHAAIVQAAPEESLEELSDNLTANWEQLYRRLSTSKLPEKEHLMSVLLRIGNELVQIDALLLD